MMFRVIDRVVRGGGCDEVGRDNLGALVHKSVEGMLAVRTRCAPDDRL
jgi:hypothetical protein